MNAQTAMDHERNSAEHARNVSDGNMWWNPAPEASAWDAQIVEEPPQTLEEMKMRESRIHVDHVRDMVPFWMKGVEAAERGEVLRMEEFLESIKEDEWSTGGDPWGYAYPPGEWGNVDRWANGVANEGGWGVGGADQWGGAHWGMSAESVSSMHAHRTRTESDRGESRRRRDKKPNPKGKKSGFRERDAKNRHRVEDHVDSYTFVEDIARQQAVGAERKQSMHMFFEVNYFYSF